MKKSMFYLLAIAAAVMTFSCQRVAEIDLPEEASSTEINEVLPPEVKMITVSCTLPISDNPDSKVTLVNNGSKGKTEWEDGDRVLFHGAKMGVVDENVYSYVAAAHDVSGDGKTAKFTIPDLASKYSGGSYISTIFAIYPADAVYSFSNGDEWDYVSAFNGTNQLLMAGYNNHNYSDPDPNVFKFINLTGALSFKVSGSFDSYVVEGNNGETLGWSKYSITAAECTSWAEERTCYRSGTGPGGTSGAITSLHVTPTDPDWDNGTTINTVFFPGTGDGTDLDGDEKAWNEAVNFTKGFTIKFYSGLTEVKRVSTSTPKNIQIGKLLDLGDITSHLIDPPTHTPAPWTSGAESLVTTKPANSYIVYHKDVDGFSGNAGKAFKIPAVKGNSATSVGTVAGVQILWETYNDTSSSVEANTVIGEVDYDDSYIYIKMPASEKMHTGNALIAAKDPMNNILWSWHIWVPSSVVSPITDSDFYATKIMDRNLGAIAPVVAAESAVPVSSFGLYYQWGRKDPFFTTDWKRNASVALSYSSDTWVSTETAIQNPTVFYKKKDTSTDPDTYNWNSSEITTLWDDGEHNKTIYDPCPEGYRIGVYNDAKRMWKHSDTSNWDANTTYGWLKYGTTITFPLAGYTENLSPYKVKERAIIWSASYLSLERSSALYTSPLPSYNSYYKFYACTVRCVQE